MEHSHYMQGQSHPSVPSDHRDNDQEGPRYDYTLPPIHRTESGSSSTQYIDQADLQSIHRPSYDDQAEISTSVGGKKRAAPEDHHHHPASGPKAKTKKAQAHTSADDNNENNTPRRAAQACLRCRKQKLKCIGGWPCNRCTKSKNVCDFGRPGLGPSAGAGTSSNINPGDGSGAGTKEANARLEQLESSVANLLAGLAGSNGSSSSTKKVNYPNNEMLHTFDPVKKRQENLQTESGAPYPPHLLPKNSSDHQGIPPPTHIKTLDPPRKVNPTQISTFSVHQPPANSMSPDDHYNNQNSVLSQNHVRFTSSPNNMNFIQQSPSGISSNGAGPSPASANTVNTGVSSVDLLREPLAKRRKGKGQKAEERLAAVTEGDFAEPPFKALTYQPSVWDNREQSRRNSPQPSQSTSRDEIPPGTYERRFMNDRDDPVNTELVDSQMAETLFGFFIDHCHPFLPIVNVALDEAFNTIRQSPFLISAILAVASRFYIKYSAKSPGSMPVLDPIIPPRLANLAEAHLSNTLLRKQHALSDVQAVLLLSAWGLQSGGRGPDAWVVTGHAARIARRLGVHKLLGQAAEIARLTRPGTVEWERLEQFMPQWRTWLCWFCFDGFLSLGFGRPQSTQFETVDEQGFLQLRLNQALPRPGSTPSISLYGDVYIAGQVQLTQIGRDLINWGEMLADPRSALWADPKRADMFHDKELNVRTMFKDLNSRLDEWCKLWVWSGSPYSLYLGSSARIARLQADHMRLCLNSFALKSGPEEDEVVAQCLKKALNAAMSTIQTHHESSQTDMALSFATDYLTITLAQAAVFLVRIAKSSPAVLSIVNIELSVISYYLKMGVELLEVGELSETRLSTYLSKTITDIARAAELNVVGFRDRDRSFAQMLVEKENPEDGGVDRPLAPHDAVLPMSSTSDALSSANDLATFEMDSFLQFENQLDLGYLLGLPGDGSAILPNNPGVPGFNNTPTPNNQNNLFSGTMDALGNTPSSSMINPAGAGAGYNAEFAFGMNGIGNFDFGLSGNWFGENENEHGNENDGANEIGEGQS
ncbi:uncharacterized protein I303_103378 [Kwoniella dejecticola CBS 10117]|uniref:Zn(2)-C6 fungal-type domain-containing protein n=1 Tax=Kwoniella dejecticola CBS 10117 TaxID=1296121 RepID=A0A1A6A6L0_9TREE|nr:uncharacterized protein I303_03401 [Kwoniella dejecticola CBS 10117]OBR85690.1 hypothetical protein I303_03401 [Kwoniella dejecticola CBS 10117]